MYQNSSVNTNTQGPVYQNPAYNGSQSNDMGWNAPVHQPPNNHSNQYPENPPPYDSVYQSKSSPSDQLPRNNNAPRLQQQPQPFFLSIPISTGYISSLQSGLCHISSSHSAAVNQVVVTPVVTRPQQQRTWRHLSTGKNYLITILIILLSMLLLFIIIPSNHHLVIISEIRGSKNSTITITITITMRKYSMRKSF
ncbi:hypothetical protein Avbf_11338 [Armadillidium vulgare]|nr:hypothetical protein Avbf_11338 [Armadillidium vulgare]